MREREREGGGRTTFYPVGAIKLLRDGGFARKKSPLYTSPVAVLASRQRRVVRRWIRRHFARETTVSYENMSSTYHGLSSSSRHSVCFRPPISVHSGKQRRSTDVCHISHEARARISQLQSRSFNTVNETFSNAGSIIRKLRRCAMFK